MSDAGIIAALGATVVSVVGAVVGATVSASRKQLADDKRRTGERIGKLESMADFERGRQEGLRQGREEAKRNGEPR